MIMAPGACLPATRSFRVSGPHSYKKEKEVMVPHRAPLGDWQLIFPTHTHTLREKPASGIYGLLAGSVQSFFSLLFTQRPAKKLP